MSKTLADIRAELEASSSKVHVVDDIRYVNDKSLAGLVTKLQAILDNIPDEHRKSARVEIEDAEEYDDYDNIVAYKRIVVRFKRRENSYECENRCEMEAFQSLAAALGVIAAEQRASQIEKQEREMLSRLKEKYKE